MFLKTPDDRLSSGFIQGITPNPMNSYSIPGNPGYSGNQKRPLSTQEPGIDTSSPFLLVAPFPLDGFPALSASPHNPNPIKHVRFPIISWIHDSLNHSTTPRSFSPIPIPEWMDPFGSSPVLRAPHRVLLPQFPHFRSVVVASMQHKPTLGGAHSASSWIPDTVW